jgi:predicted RNA-binding protein YlqC (UPF0109 family)
MRVDELAPSKGAKKKPKRVGRGIGGKGGKTATALRTIVNALADGKRIRVDVVDTDY